GGMTPAEFERMRRDADSHAAEDKSRRELVDTRNHADQMIYQIEKMLKDNAAKISDTDKGPIQAAIEKVKQAASKDDVNAIKQAISELEQASHAMAQHLYSKGQQPGGGGPEAGPTGDGHAKGEGKEDVIDAEF